MPDESEVIVVNKIKFAHYSMFPKDKWRWKNFSPQEMASRREGELMITEAAMDKLQALRDLLGKPLIVNSAYRSEAHNRAVGGAKNSYHLKAEAFDVRMDNHDPVEFEAAARKVGFTGFGYYPKNGFMHIDIGPARSWGTKFPVKRATPSFAPEKPLVPETPQQDSIIGAVGVVASTGIVGQVGSAVGGLSEYAQYGLVAVAALALAWIVYKRLK